EDRPAGRVHCHLERSLDLAAVLAVGVPEARDDEQGVIDADAEADHQCELGGEVDHVDEVAAEADHAETGAKAEHCRHDRQAHREHRAEAEKQHEHGPKRPTPVAKPMLACWACLIAWPPSSTCSAGERTASAVVITR